MLCGWSGAPHAPHNQLHRANAHKDRAKYVRYVAAARTVQGQREALKTGTAAPAFYFSLRDQVSYLARPLCFCLGGSNSVSGCLCVTPPPPIPFLALRSAAGHVPDPVREVTWGPVFGGPLHLLVPVCAVCHRAFPLQDPAGLQSGETQQDVCVVASKLCVLCFFSPPPAVYLLLRLLSSLMRESLKKFLTSRLLPPSVSRCYGVAAGVCFVPACQPGHREAEACSSRANNKRKSGAQLNLAAGEIRRQREGWELASQQAVYSHAVSLSQFAQHH